MSSPSRQLDRRSTPSPFRPENRWTLQVSAVDLSPYRIKEYLARFPVFLEDYLLQTMSAELLETILNKKKSTHGLIKNDGPRRQSSLGKLGTLYSEMGLQEASKRIIDSTSDEEIYKHIYDVSHAIALGVNADAFAFYLVDPSQTEVLRYGREIKGEAASLKHVGPVGPKMTVSAHVAFDKKAINIADLQQDARFPKGTVLGDDTVHHVMCLPLLQENGRCYALVEFCRRWEKDAFTGSEFELTNAIYSWITACVQKMKKTKLLRIQSTLNSYLLETTRVMFDDMDKLDTLTTNIMTFAKDLVSADRCSLFLVDDEKQELYADYFDDGEKAEDGTPLYTKRAQIRFPVSRGISGYVARTGEVVNIKDAYQDDRFNPEVDKKTGYHTKNILCMPIHGKHGVTGVVQLINRLHGHCFTDEDEESFKLFAIYCALALHFSRLYNALIHQKTKYKVAMEVLEFHLVCPEEEVETLQNEYELADDIVPLDLYSFDYCCYDDDAILPQLFIKLVHDTFGEKELDLQRLCRFVLTVRKNYRPITYHNWQHGFHVAHALWLMVRSAQKFTTLEKLALIIGGICHDLDHRGYNNAFFKNMNLPLAALYSSSTMEQHHYRQTVTILHAEGHDIFSHLSPGQHTEILSLIRQNIIATDLALYFDNQKYLTGLLSSGEFDSHVPRHREAMMSLMMTGADLCAVPKPWETQKHTVDFLYNEFFMQGDIEKAAGLTPLPMMDRLQKDDIPKQQVGFINFICKPLYTTLAKLVPEAQPLLDGCENCLENWSLVVAENEAKKSTLQIRTTENVKE